MSEPTNNLTRSRRGNRQRGFTLMELMVSVSIMGALAGVITTSSFAMIKAQATTNSQAQVAIEVSKSTRWLARDIHRAASSNVVDGAAAVATADFTWTDGGALVSCAYSLNAVDNFLVRTCSGAPQNVANGISGLLFTRSGDLVTAAYTVTSSLNAARTEDVELIVLVGGG